MKDLLVDFGIPAMLIIGAFILFGLGIDGEVKSILVMAGAWAFHGVVTRKRSRN